MNVKNKSYNFIQPNFMFISKLHNTQSKFSGKEASSQSDNQSVSEKFLSLLGVSSESANDKITDNKTRLSQDQIDRINTLRKELRNLDLTIIITDKYQAEEDEFERGELNEESREK